MSDEDKPKMVYLGGPPAPSGPKKKTHWTVRLWQKIKNRLL